MESAMFQIANMREVSRKKMKKRKRCLPHCEPKTGGTSETRRTSDIRGTFPEAEPDDDHHEEDDLEAKEAKKRRKAITESNNPFLRFGLGMSTFFRILVRLTGVFLVLGALGFS